MYDIHLNFGVTVKLAIVINISCAINIYMIFLSAHLLSFVYMCIERSKKTSYLHKLFVTWPITNKKLQVQYCLSPPCTDSDRPLIEMTTCTYNAFCCRPWSTCCGPVCVWRRLSPSWPSSTSPGGPHSTRPSVSVTLTVNSPSMPR